MATRYKASPPTTDDPSRPSPSSISHQSSPNPPNTNESLPLCCAMGRVGWVLAILSPDPIWGG